jgi:hypothetical protein
MGKLGVGATILTMEGGTYLGLQTLEGLTIAQTLSIFLDWVQVVKHQKGIFPEDTAGEIDLLELYEIDDDRFVSLYKEFLNDFKQEWHPKEK